MGWNGPLARSGGRPARQRPGFRARPISSVTLEPGDLGGKLPPSTARLAVLPENKWGARPSRLLQSASRRLAFADEHATQRFSRLAAECFRPEAENGGRHARQQPALRARPISSVTLESGARRQVVADFSFQLSEFQLLICVQVPKVIKACPFQATQGSPGRSESVSLL
jgi:hypothetical protein